MKKLQIALLLSLLISNTVFAFNDGDGSGLLAIVIFMYVGPLILIVSLISLIVMGFKRALKKVILPLIIGFLLVEITLFVLGSNGIDVV